MKNKKKLKKLKKLLLLKRVLNEMRENHMAAWNMYGSELSSGGMIADEKILEDKIKKLEKKLNE